MSNSTEENPTDRIDVTVNNIFDEVILLIAVALFASTIGVTLLQVLVRNTTLLPTGLFFWTGPLSTILFIILTYFGVAVAARNSEHISIKILLNRFEDNHPMSILILEFVSSIIVITVLYVSINGTFQLTISRWNQGVGGIAVITVGYIYLGITIGLLSTLLYYITILVKNSKTIYQQAMEA